MTADAFGTDSDATALPVDHDTGRASRRWRTLWRVHFYAGMISMPFIILMAVTGLIILYTQPIQDLTQGDLRTVRDSGDWISFDQQEQAVEAAYPDAGVVSMIMPSTNTHSTIFGLDNDREVFVNPYTGVVLGQDDPGGGIVGFSNRLHGTLNNAERSVSLPTVSALWDDGPVMRDYVIGDLLLEIAGVWVLVLAASGIYLWWPRRSRSVGGLRNGRTLFGIRLSKKGRARWRDLHAVPGVLLFAIMAVTLMSGMAWSAYWGANFAALSAKVTPSSWEGNTPASTVGTRGELDRLGNQIHWNTGDIPIPASYASEPSSGLPAPVSLDSVVAIGTIEKMKPGYSVYFPDNSQVDDVGNPIYGTFVLSNSWPRATGDARDVFIDQFSGTHLDEMGGWGLGTLSYAMDTMVEWHMGAQWGIVSRVLMTLLCVLAIWSCTSGLVMYWKRRRPGTIGLPRRPAAVGFGWGMWAILAVLAIAYPEWGVTAVALLLIDRFAIRKIPRLRTAFGQR